MMAKQEDLSSMLEERLEMQLKKTKKHNSKVVTEALKTFDKVYKSKQKTEKSTQAEHK